MNELCNTLGCRSPANGGPQLEGALNAANRRNEAQAEDLQELKVRRHATGQPHRPIVLSLQIDLPSCSSARRARQSSDAEGHSAALAMGQLPVRWHLSAIQSRPRKQECGLLNLINQTTELRMARPAQVTAQQVCQNHSVCLQARCQDLDHQLEKALARLAHLAVQADATPERCRIAAAALRSEAEAAAEAAAEEALRARRLEAMVETEVHDKAQLLGSTAWLWPSAGSSLSVWRT